MENQPDIETRLLSASNTAYKTDGCDQYIEFQRSIEPRGPFEPPRDLFLHPGPERPNRGEPSKVKRRCNM